MCLLKVTCRSLKRNQASDSFTCERLLLNSVVFLASQDSDSDYVPRRVSVSDASETSSHSSNQPFVDGEYDSEETEDEDYQYTSENEIELEEEILVDSLLDDIDDGDRK